MHNETNEGMKGPIIFTLGTSTHGKEGFIELLKHYRIETVVDVRSFPQSRFEHFKKENLERILREEEKGSNLLLTHLFEDGS